VESLQILRALLRETYGWKHHPATLMWRGYEDALGLYGLTMVDEWQRRGRPDSVAPQLIDELGHRPRRNARRPPWLGDEAFHRAHRSNLLRKDAEWYRPFFPDEPDDLEYVWPVSRGWGAGAGPSPASSRRC
jgi:hypothetical protein